MSLVPGMVAILSAIAIIGRREGRLPSHRSSAENRTGRRLGSLDGIVTRAEDLARLGFLHGKFWSLAQICEHLARSVDNTVRGSAADGVPLRWQRLSRFQKVTRSVLKHLMLLTGYFPKGVPAPESVHPSTDVSLGESLNRLRSAAEAFDRKLEASRSSWGWHSLLGRMSGRAWRRFHHIHAAHHFSFLRPAKTD